MTLFVAVLSLFVAVLTLFVIIVAVPPEMVGTLAGIRSQITKELSEILVLRSMQNFLFLNTRK